MRDGPKATDTEVENVIRGRQQWLLPPARPLVERFGHAFFRALPKEPGVYIMRGSGGRPRRPRVLYVGKARNLRQRLGSYRHVHPDRDSRKTVRLVHAVEDISWEICADETAALLRENELLREHRPLFNRANVRPEAHGCIGMRREGNLIEFRLGEPSDDGWFWFGSFKGGRRFALAALLRLLIQASRPIVAWSQLPRPLLSDRAPVRFSYSFAAARDLTERLQLYFTGRSWELVDRLSAALEHAQVSEPFLNAWRVTDLETIRSFYLNGPRRNRRWREQLGLANEEILRPEDLDDLPIKVKLAAETSPWAEVVEPAALTSADEAPTDG